MKTATTKETPYDFKQPWLLRIIRITGFGILNLLAVILVATVALLAWMRLTNKPMVLPVDQSPAISAPQNSSGASPAGQVALIDLPFVNSTSSNIHIGISRKAMLMTTIPSRSRSDIITYTVKSGDTLFSIAEQYNIQPATLLWGNFDVLEDNPHLLKPGQILNVLPLDGTYYQWKDNDTLNSVADYFKTKADNIIEFTGNGIDLTKIDQKNSGIEVGQWIVVPGGKRAIKDWGPPAISRSNPASARAYGPGSCGQVYEGAVGTQDFIYPTVNHFISGYNYDPGVHPAIDLGGNTGDAIFASDSGVVVYAGWSDFGYGYLIVIDHGFGWQTAYAHLSAVGVSCGQSVFKGGVIGAMGATGNATGPHLHFELSYNGAKLNPLDFIH
jgi:murein DD-endopeptidase MepM/ murein hydrolase activator NlpD